MIHMCSFVIFNFMFPLLSVNIQFVSDHSFSFLPVRIVIFDCVVFCLRAS